MTWTDDDWKQMFVLRDMVNKALEPYKANKQKTIDSKLIIGAPHNHPIHKLYRGEWVDFFLVSCVYTYTAEKIEVEVEKATGIKCERCGKWDEFEYKSITHPNLCDRCDRVMNMIEWDERHKVQANPIVNVEQ